ncbi:TRAP transporter substrate-binding protein [Pseudooceanicola nitratireducens]|uniref:TRAP transporter substrate-binding protein n=1 Tax=Pseudooceanicola nitratireducens TaxID=517719 RepID=UPI0023F41BD9|nr:TRAP transporter substrate-binding protein [Pseudooceanicola nitratireducens]
MIKNIVGALALAITAASVQAETLTLASPAPGPAPLNKAFQMYADAVSEASGGDVKINVVAGGTLGRHGQLLDRVQAGVVDIAWDFQGYYPNRFPRSSVAELPFMFSTSLEGSMAIQSLFDAGQLGNEYDDFVVLGLWAFPNNSVMLTQELPASGDLSGLKMSAQNPTMYAAAESLGAVPVAMGIPDWYPALSRGTIDGAVVAFTAVPAFRFQEVATHFYKTSLGGNTGMIFMNKAKFESLSPEAQEAMMSVSGAAMAEMMGSFLNEQAQNGEGLASTTAEAIVELDEAAAAKWQEAVAPLRTNWLEAGNGDQALIDAMSAAVAAAK